MNKVILGVAFVLSLAACQQGQKIAYVDNSKLLDDFIHNYMVFTLFLKFRYKCTKVNEDSIFI